MSKKTKLNRQIYLGGSILMTIVLMVILLPHFIKGAPDDLRPWLGCLPPGSCVPSVVSHHAFKVGSEPVGLKLPKQETLLELQVEAVAYRQIRVTLDSQSKVISLIDMNGAFTLDSFDLSTLGNNDWIKTDQGRQQIHFNEGVLRRNQTIPQSLASQLVGRVFFVHQLMTGSTIKNTYQVSVNHLGVVTRIEDQKDHAMQELIVAGESITKFSMNGKEQWKTFYLGTDLLGRDLLLRLLYGAAISLMIAMVSTLVSLLIGVTYGAISGYCGGWVDRVLMSTVDILYGLPFMFLVIILLVNFGRSLLMLFVALGCVQWLTMSRIVRSGVMSLKEREYVQAARVSGATPWQIIWGHILPNQFGLIVVYASMTVPAVIMEESFLSFIGLSVQMDGRSLDSLGTLVSQGMDALGHGGERFWMLLAPSLLMVTLLLSLNLLGDGLRDYLDPKMKK